MKKLLSIALMTAFFCSFFVSVAAAGDDGIPASNPIYMAPQTGTLYLKNNQVTDITVYRIYPRFQLPSSVDIVGGVAPNTTVTFSDLPPGTYEVRTGDKNAKTFEIIAGKTAIIGT